MTQQVFIGFHHFALRSPNLLQSVDFYTKLGFHQVHEWRLPEYAIEHAVLMQAPDGKSWIEIFDFDAEIPLQGERAKQGVDVVTGALAHICLRVNDLAIATDLIVEVGARHLYGPENLRLGEPSVLVRNAIFEGPADEVIELLQAVQFPGDRPES